MPTIRRGAPSSAPLASTGVPPQRITTRALFADALEAVRARFRAAVSTQRRYQEHLLGSTVPFLVSVNTIPLARSLRVGACVSNSTSVRQREPLRPTDWVRLALPLLLVATLTLIAWKLHYFEPERLTTAASRVRHAWWFGLAYVAVFGVIAALPTPASPLAYAAGALFGVVQGSLLAWCGLMLGAAAGYWLARGAWADTAARLLGRNEDKLRDMRERKAFLVTLRLRLIPIVPFGVFTYAAGAVKIAFPAYLVGTAIGTVPYVVAAVFAGERVAAGFRGGGRGPFLVAAAVTLALIGVSFLPTVIRKLRER